VRQEIQRFKHQEYFGINRGTSRRTLSLRQAGKGAWRFFYCDGISVSFENSFYNIDQYFC
jgi:hypothetical protein